MKLKDVMREITTAATAIDRLKGRSFHYTVRQVTPPAFIVDLPDSITFDGGYARGMDLMVVPFTVVVGMVNAESSEDELSEFLDGSGPRSVKAAVEGHVYTSCDSVVVTSVENAVVTFASAQYLAALFTSNVVGRGA